MILIDPCVISIFQSSSIKWGCLYLFNWVHMVMLSAAIRIDIYLCFGHVFSSHHHFDFWIYNCRPTVQSNILTLFKAPSQKEVSLTLISSPRGRRAQDGLNNKDAKISVGEVIWRSLADGFRLEFKALTIYTWLVSTLNKYRF